MKANNTRFIDLKKDVLKVFNEDLQIKMAKTVWQSGGCHSWYQDRNGKNVTLWPGFTYTFVQRTKKFEADKYDLVK